MANKQTEELSSDEIVDSLLSDLPFNVTQEVTLPSGKVAKIKPITFEEEKAMISMSKKGGDATNILISKCVSDIEMHDILLVDKIYLLFKLRELSFGSNYRFTVGCPGCKRENNITVDLNNLDVNTLEEADGLQEVVLPMSNKKCVVRLASLADEQYTSQSEIMMDNLWRFVESFEGHKASNVIQKVLRRLPAGDINKIISVASCEGYGIATEVRVVCSHCGHDSVMDLPLNKNFFSVS